MSGIADKISNIFEFSIVITDEDYNVDGAVDDDMNISEGGGNLRDDLLKISGGSDSFSKYFGELDKFIVSPQDRNDTWLTFYFVMGAKVPEIPKEGMRDMMKYNLLGVWHDNKFFVTTFQTRMPLYYFFDPTIDDYNDAVNYYSDNLPLSGMNVDVSPYTSSIDDGIKLVVTVTILDKGEFYKNNSNIIINLNRQEPQDVYLRVSLLTHDGSLTSTDYTFYELYKVVDKDIWKIEIPVLNDKNYLLEISSVLQVKLINMNNTGEDILTPCLAVVYKSIRT